MPFAGRHSLKSVRELPPHVSDLSLTKYSQPPGQSPTQARSLIGEFISDVYGTNWKHGSSGGPVTPTCGPPVERATARIDGAAELGVVEIGVDAERNR